MGFDIAIDDFGTGYSSMSYLKRFPIDYLKIDRTFIKDLPDDKEDVAITRAMIALAASMHLQVIAEGVETEAQRRFLEYEHCHEIQGYLISKPLPAAAVGTFFSEHTPGVRRVQ
jgi:EAL domain-containing protein (putative c-di-GMP-specific phosphodiesterase class I)